MKVFFYSSTLLFYLLFLPASSYCIESSVQHQKSADLNKKNIKKTAINKFYDKKPPNSEKSIKTKASSPQKITYSYDSLGRIKKISRSN